MIMVDRHINTLFILTAICFLFILLCVQTFAYNTQNSYDAQLQKLKTDIIGQNKHKIKEASNSCTKPTIRPQDSKHPLHRHPRDVAGGSRRRPSLWDTAVYFSGKEALRLRLRMKRGQVDIPRENFTVEFWTRPAGGQPDPVTIISLVHTVDDCPLRSTAGGWSIGIRSSDDAANPKPKFYLEFKTEQSAYSSVLNTNIQYVSDTWYHIAVTYDTEVVRFYINGAQIAVGQDQQGALFGEVTRRCKQIHLGGDDGKFYRGRVDDLRVWNRTLSHENIVDTLNGVFDEAEYDLILEESFNNLKKWKKLSSTLPELLTSDMHAPRHNIILKATPCGETVCDDPSIIRSYQTNEQLRETKELRYRVVNVMDDTGSNPIVTQEQIQEQHRVLVEAFSPYNITWKLHQYNVMNTTLRRKAVLLTCDPSDVGNGFCDNECRNSRTGNDGGDCEPFMGQCNRSLIANGRCDFECNKKVYDWDGGDCCIPGPATHLSCFDPTSPQRGYLGVEEYKDWIGLRGSSHLNVYMASYGRVIGLATMPWDKDVHSVKGGIVVHPMRYGVPGQSKNLVHELGHVLGLWHVHHGVTEMECSDACLETHPSLELGDLCSDTNPTPNNTQCREADWTNQYCGIAAYDETPYTNYMGYGYDQCINNFTLQQTARMHCYIDLVYQPWSPSKIPSPIPLPPRVVSTTNRTVSIVWMSPLGSKHASVMSLCDLCNDADVVNQYVSSANATSRGIMGTHFSAVQAEGHPDSKTCDFSSQVWMPDANDCSGLQCFIDLEFDFPIVPKRLTVWVVWSATDSIRQIDLFYTNGGNFSLGEYTTYCDTPLTIELNVYLPINKVRIYVTSPFVGVDAAQLSTESEYIGCLSCQSRKYRITRDPSFPGSVVKQTKKPEYTDREVEVGQNYTYVVRVKNGPRESEISPFLKYTHGEAYCGDGHVNSDKEECDDGNLIDGDGCNIDCGIEEAFQCRGEKSICFLHDGDGVCEDFERASNVKDCGYFTPEGFEDQWAISATSNPQYQGQGCPSSLITGPPNEFVSCSQSVDEERAWHPCGQWVRTGNFWIEVYFAEPVVAAAVFVYLDSDGKVRPDMSDPPIRIELLADNSTSDPISVHTQFVNCRKNPIAFHLRTDWQNTFRLTSGIRIRFSEQNMSFAGVLLRSPRNWNPIQQASCSVNETYNHNSGRCVPRSCVTTCQLLPIQNGRSICTGFQEGDTCQASCNSGYELSGYINEYTCINGTWRSMERLSCIRVVCEEPEIPFATVACPNGTRYGDECIFKCNPPAKLTGHGTTVECEAGGRWSLPEAHCQVKCSSPHQMVNHATLIAKRCLHGNHPVGKKCKFKCFKGYHTEGKAPGRRNVHLECSEDGRWTGGSCERTECPRFNPAFVGLYTCTGSSFAGSRCTLRCPDGERDQIITCTYAGVWSDSFTMCRSYNGTCPMLEIRQGDIELDCDDNYIGHQCRVSCLFPNHHAEVTGGTNRVRNHLASSDFTALDRPVRKTTCTALYGWQPDPSSISCVEQCNEESISDGWCDAVNNKDRCEWDGGDCCTSTSFTGYVEPFPATCTHACTCKDPNALENRIKRKKKKIQNKELRSRARMYEDWDIT